MTPMIEIPPENKLTVYYDGACPKCIRDKESYEKLAGSSADQVCWFDITGQDKQLRELGIDPKKALSELHVRQPNGWIVSEQDAYILLLNKALDRNSLRAIENPINRKRRIAMSRAKIGSRASRVLRWVQRQE